MKPISVTSCTRHHAGNLMSVPESISKTLTATVHLLLEVLVCSHRAPHAPNYSNVTICNRVKRFFWQNITVILEVQKHTGAGQSNGNTTHTRYYRVLTMVYNTQRYWVFGLCPSSGFFLNK
jgi:hypothetical protein